ncbi:trimeric LpxA-like protein [Moesziomyces antarcticus]|uniref:Dynactin subunit 6 n=1 Tax=Pseudozyma antarctica TaxID=84753 RepID=A0A081CDB9_PSEA2|nr:trimeric LpxA-like protein [Moesziomyces antarcticus]GAK64665.1 trimeric LpxA-like protein [Moesziomyces antarcticus]
MSLLRALQSSGILTDQHSHPPAPRGTVRLVPQALTSDSFLSPSDRTSVEPSTISPSPCRRDNLIVGTRVIIAQDADLRGEISVGSGTVIHPKATILALQAPISIGSDCIIEETAVIVNRTSQPIKIGDANLFEVGCRIEAASIGSCNVFEPKSKVAHNVAIGSNCVVGAGCTLLPRPVTDDQLASLFDDEDALESTPEQNGEAETKDKRERVFETLPDRTVVYGSDSRRRVWSGEGAHQQAALHAKHLEYLRDTIPRTHKLKIIQGVRAPPPTSTAAS